MGRIQAFGLCFSMSKSNKITSQPTIPTHSHCVRYVLLTFYRGNLIYIPCRCISIEVNIKIQRAERRKISKSYRHRPARLCALILRTDKTLNSYCFALVSEEIEHTKHLPNKVLLVICHLKVSFVIVCFIFALKFTDLIGWKENVGISIFYQENYIFSI